MAFHFLQIHLNHSSFPSPHSEIDKSSRPHLGGGSAVGIDKSAPWSKPTNFWPQLSWQHFRLSSQPWAKFQEMARERRLSSEKWNFLNCRLQLFSENFDRVRCCSLFYFRRPRDNKFWASSQWHINRQRCSQLPNWVKCIISQIISLEFHNCNLIPQLNLRFKSGISKLYPQRNHLKYQIQML